MNWLTNLFKKKDRKRKAGPLHPGDPLLYVNDADSNPHHPSHPDNSAMLPSHHSTSHYDGSSHNSDSSGFDFGGHHGH